MAEKVKDPQATSVSTTGLSRRTLLAGTGAAVAGAAMTGSASASKASKVYSAPAVIQDRITIPLFTVENDPDSLAFYEETERLFQEQVDPNVQIEVSVYQDENILQFVGTAFETGTDLGIFSSFESQIAVWAEQGYLLPLNSIIESVGRDDFLPGTLLAVDGQEYIMPSQANASALWARTDLLEAEGLGLPATYDELVGALEALHGKDGMLGIATAVGNVPNMTTQFFAPYLYQSGWEFFDAQGNLTFDQPAVLEAVKRFQKVLTFTTPSMYNGTYPDIINLFGAGRAAFATFPGRLGYNIARQDPELAEKITVIPVPAGPFMTGQLHFGGASPFSIYADTAHPEEAKAFLEFMLTGERLLELSMTVPGHILPPLESVRAMVPTYESEYMDQHGDWVITFNDLVPQAFSPDNSMGSVSHETFHGKLSNICPWGSQIWDTDPVDGRMFQQIMIEGMDPEQAWTEAYETLGTIREEWLAENPDWEPEVQVQATPAS
jgi:ABC-type glycerol-3-phosphate transport system substrate-binding protein